jgi:hypothetical protein
MLLEDATTIKQVDDAIDACEKGTATEEQVELCEDIEEKLYDAAQEWERAIGHGDGYLEDDWNAIDVDDIVRSDLFTRQFIRDSPVDLSQIPVEAVQSGLRYITNHSSHFVLNVDGGGGMDGFSYSVPLEMSAYFPSDLVPKNAELLPEEVAEDFWEGLGHEVTWDQTDVVADNYGHAPSYTEAYITLESEAFYEISRDILSAYYTDVMQSDEGRKSAIEEFLGSLHGPYQDVARKVLSEEDLADFAHRYLIDREDIQDIQSDMDDLVEYMEPSDEPPEVLAEVTRDDIRKMGITSGPLYENAPWVLVKLRPFELPIEGTRMRHCVGDKGMGYIEALHDGDVEIWSLRSGSPTGKPRFTLEVEPDDRYPDLFTRREKQVGAVKQLKGKTNRVPGLPKPPWSYKEGEEVRLKSGRSCYASLASIPSPWTT